MSAERLDGAAYARRGGTSRPTRVRIVHLGLGNFHRAHQAWYTAHATDASDWGIAAFTGRSPQQADQLRPQDGLYALVVRDGQADRVEIVPSIIEVQPASRLDRLVELLEDSAVVIVTLTITEGGYGLTGEGLPDVSDPAVGADIAVLQAALGREDAPLRDIALGTALGRLLAALEARRRAGAGAISIVPCDNIPDNGEYVRRGLTAIARDVSNTLVDWVERNVSFVSTSVDRITPRIDGPVLAVREADWVDASSVVTEPFSDWILSGAFPAGRPAWENAGARFVNDLEPWENRKLWLLNGAHSILAFAGLSRGLKTVTAAIEEPACFDLVTAFWDECVTLLPAGIEHEQYRRDLLARFRNPRIKHQLAQIAVDATTKVRYRFATVAERSVRSGAIPAASAGAVAAWISALSEGVLPPDSSAKEISAALGAEDRVAALLALISPSLAQHAGFRELVVGRLRVSAVLGASPISQGQEQK